MFLARTATEAGDTAAAALALRAASVAARTSDAAEARRFAAEAVAVADRGGHEEIAGRARVTLAGVMALTGDTAGAAGLLNAVTRRGTGRAVAEAAAQLAFLAFHRGEYTEAARDFDAALTELSPFDVWTAMVLSNRALARAYVGELIGAEADLLAAIDCYVQLGCVTDVAECRGNLGWVKARQGDCVSALEWFASSEDTLAERGYPLGYIRRDRAHSYIAVGLAESAAEDARRSADEFDAAGLRGERAESLRTLAVALELTGDLAAAERFGLEAEALFREEARPVLADEALLVALRARVAASVAPETVDQLHDLADRLALGGSIDAALEARLAAAAAASVVGDPHRALADLRSARAAGDVGRVELRLAYWCHLAEARLRVGDSIPALHAARAAVRSLDEFQRQIGATEARVNVAASAQGLARVAVAATAHADPARLFGWIERLRGAALRYRPVFAVDSRLDLERDELRNISNALARGTPPDDGVRGSGPALAARQRDLERSIGQRLLRSRGGDRAVHCVSAHELRCVVGDARLISYVDHERHTLAITIERDRIACTSLGPTDDIRNELDHVRAGLTRIAMGAVSPLVVGRVRNGLERLDHLVLAPVASVGSGPLVVVPTGDLLPVPWAVLPSGAHRPVTVAPSASLWAAARWRGEDVEATRRVVLAAGPGLAHAEGELAALDPLYPAATTFGATTATTAALLDAIDGCALFHIACHGVFRADNPLFSHLQVADGPLALYDLERIAAPPRTVVLSACDSGRAQPRPGDQWLGLVSTLLSLGTRSLVASVMPVPDTTATVELMAALHGGLRAGVAPAEALARIPIPPIEDDPQSFAARAAFLSFGA